MTKGKRKDIKDAELIEKVNADALEVAKEHTNQAAAPLFEKIVEIREVLNELTELLEQKGIIDSKENERIHQRALRKAKDSIEEEWLAYLDEVEDIHDAHDAFEDDF